MKQKLEFPLFSSLWISSIFELVLSTSNDCILLAGAIGIFTCAASILFAKITPVEDDIVGMLLKPIVVFMSAAVLVSSIVVRNPLMLSILGPTIMILLRVERRYAYERSYND